MAAREHRSAWAGCAGCASAANIADLHSTLQTALGWTDEYLNRFVTHGREYGLSHSGGIGFGNTRAKCGWLISLRVGERFLYEYDFIDGWRLDVRVECMLPLDPRRRYPMCIGGRRAVPPEDFGGPWVFLELRQLYSIISIADPPAHVPFQSRGDKPVYCSPRFEQRRSGGGDCGGRYGGRGR